MLVVCVQPTSSPAGAGAGQQTNDRRVVLGSASRPYPRQVEVCMSLTKADSCKAVSEDGRVQQARAETTAGWTRWGMRVDSRAVGGWR